MVVAVGVAITDAPLVVFKLPAGVQVYVSVPLASSALVYPGQTEDAEATTLSTGLVTVTVSVAIAIPHVLDSVNCKVPLVVAKSTVTELVRAPDEIVAPPLAVH